MIESLRQWCQDLREGSPPNRRLAWKRLSAEGLWKSCSEMVAHPSPKSLALLGEPGCAGRLVFGRLDEVVAKLGAEYAALVVPMDGFDQLLLH